MMASGLKVRRAKPDAVATELKGMQKGKSTQEKPKINVGDAAALKRVLDDAAITVINSEVDISQSIVLCQYWSHAHTARGQGNRVEAAHLTVCACRCFRRMATSKTSQ